MRKKAVQALAGFGPEAIPRLIEILQTDSEVEVRVYALALLSDTPPLGREVFHAIFNALKDPDGTVKFVAADTLLFIVPRLGQEVVPDLAEAPRVRHSRADFGPFFGLNALRINRLRIAPGFGV